MIAHYPKVPGSCVLSFISPRLKYPISDTGTVHWIIKKVVAKIEVPATWAAGVIW